MFAKVKQLVLLKKQAPRKKKQAPHFVKQLVLLFTHAVDSRERLFLKKNYERHANVWNY